MKSRCGPSGRKLVTLNQLVFWLSLGPLFVPTAYFRISCPVLVACSSGVSANRPTIVIFAKEDLPAEVENGRALVRTARRRRKEDISGFGKAGLRLRSGAVIDSGLSSLGSGFGGVLKVGGDGGGRGAICL